MRKHRTTARGAFLLTLLTALSLAAASATHALPDPPEPGAAADSDAIIFPVVGSREVLRRLRRSPRPGPPRGQRHPHDVALSGRRRRGRHDQVLDDLRAGRLHALPLRRERDDLPLHPPQQRPHGEARQPRQVCPGRLVRRRAQERRPRQGRPDDRATTATPAMPRGRITSTSRCTRTTAPMSTRSRS